MFCTKCGTKVEEENKFCSNCGYGIDASVKEQGGGSSGEADFRMEGNIDNLEESGNPDTENSDTEETTNSEDEAKRLSAVELAAFAGGNVAYFTTQFSNIEKGQRGNFNWAALFFNINYCLYRKQYSLIKTYFLFPMGLMILIFTYFLFCMQTFSIEGLIACTVLCLANSVLSIVMSVTLGGKFNELYYNELQEKKQYVGTSMQNVIIYLVCCGMLSTGFGICARSSIMNGVIVAIDRHLSGEEFYDFLGDYDEESQEDSQEDSQEESQSDAEVKNQPEASKKAPPKAPPKAPVKKEIALNALPKNERIQLEDIATIVSYFSGGELSTSTEKLECIIFFLQVSYFGSPEIEPYCWTYDDGNVYFLAGIVDEMYYKYFGQMPTPTVTESVGYYYDYEYSSDVYYTYDGGIGFDYHTIINKFVDNGDGTYEMTVHEISPENQRIGAFIVDLRKDTSDSADPYKIVGTRNAL